MKISDSTESDYHTKASRLVYWFEAGMRMQAAERHEEFYEWLKELSRDWAPSTILKYRAALNWYSRKTDYIPSVPPSVLDPKNSTRRKRQDRGKAAQKSKFVNPKALNVLKDMASEGRRSQKLQWAIALIKAGIAFGLRPIEWYDAYLDESDPNSLKLIVHNAKNNDERPNAEYRTLYIVAPEIIEDEIKLVKKIMEAIKEEGLDSRDAWEKHIRAVSSQLSKTVSRGPSVLKNSGLTLYSARHQFAANAKKAGLSMEEIAALMGHSTKYTAEEHYGKRRKGYSGIKSKWAILPDPEEVERVIERSRNTARGQKEAVRSAARNDLDFGGL